MTSYIEKMLNKKFGKLTVYEIFRGERRNNARGYTYLCKCSCDCGEKITSSCPTVLSGKTTSCGCKKDYFLTGANHQNFTGYLDITGSWFGRIKYKAKIRHIEVSITIKDVWELYLKQDKVCALTGIDIYFGKKYEDTTASLDRINSKLGYTIDNIQLVHKVINIMKNNLDVKDFINRCRLVDAGNK